MNAQKLIQPTSNLLQKLKPKKFILSKNLNSYNRKNYNTTRNLFKWLRLLKNKKYVRYRFLVFIFGVVDKNSGSNFYLEQLRDIYCQKKISFHIAFEHLVLSDPLLSIWLTDEPEIILKIFQYACEEIVSDIFQKPNRRLNIPVRFYGLPLCESMRNLKKKKPNCLVKIRGVVLSKTQIFPTIGFFYLTCLKCLETQETLFSTTDQKIKRIKNCFNCKSTGPFQTKWDRLISNKFQKISIQEGFKNNSFRWLPYSNEIILIGDLIDYANHGDNVEITGILKYSTATKSNHVSNHPTFLILIEANSIQKIREQENFFKISFFEVQILERVTTEQRLLSCLLLSFIPDIFDNYYLKLLILLTYCSPSQKKKTNVKSNDTINMLILGDISVGKSKVLKLISDFFPYSQYLTGQGSTIKGLTSSLKHDKLVGEWVSEGGLLTMAKNGICLIEGLEGLLSKDLNSLCKILDQHYIQIDQKSSLDKMEVTFSTIATLNNFNTVPNPSLPFFLNYGLNDESISRFEIIHNLEKNGNLENEKNLAKFLLARHQGIIHSKRKIKINKINSKIKMSDHRPECLSENFINKYLYYCRNNFSPKYCILDQSFILKFYLDLKRETHILSSLSFSSNFLETIIRIVSSSAKIHLRNQVSEKDLSIGLLIFFESWIQIQPQFTASFLRSKYKRFFSRIFIKYKDCHIFLEKKGYNQI